MTNKPHKHADALRAIADGVPLYEFEGRFLRGDGGWSEWLPLENFNIPMITNVEEPEIRRKQKTITVNGFQVPEPCRVMPEPGTKVFIPSLEFESWYVAFTSFCLGEAVDSRIIQRGLVHLTRDAAIAHAKALLGIDPNAPEEIAAVRASAAGGAK